MKQLYLKTNLLAAISLLVMAFCSTFILAQAPVTITYTHTGAVQQLTVPACVGSMSITAWGAAGGVGGTSGGSAGNGGYAFGVITATPGQVMYFFVGGQGSVTTGGFNGGGGGGTSSTSQGSGGGGASDVRIGGNTLTDRILVAAGGGGGGGNSTYGANGAAGGGGSFCASPYGVGGSPGTGFGTGNTAGACLGGTAPNYASGGAGGGTTSGGGGGGAPSSSTGGYGCAGTLGNGGAGGGTSFICGGATGGVNGGGGGGGGYYGGGGGMTGTGGGNGGGGGGSSYINYGLFSSPSFTTLASSAGNGSIVITYVYNGTGVSVSPSFTAICNGQSTGISAGGVVTYTWLPVGSFLGSNSSSISVNPNATTTYTLNGTNTLGCVSQTMITVNVAGTAPVLSITSSTNSLCLGKTATVTATGALTYTWSNGIVNGVSFLPGPGVNAYTVSGQNGCGISTAVTTITVAALPVTVLSTPSLVCQGYPATLTAASAVTGYTWQPISLYGSSVIVAPTANTIYTVTASDGTCSGVATLTLNTKITPTITATAVSTVICQGQSVVLSAGGGSTYNWTPGNLSGNSITVTPSGSTLYSVDGTNSVGCTASANQVIIVNPSPVIAVNANKTMACIGDVITLLASGASSYSWSNGPSTAGYTVIPTASTVYSVSGLQTGNICAGSNTISIAIIVPNVTVASSPTAVCAGGTATLTAGGASSYTWNGIPGPSSQVVAPVGNIVYNLTANTQSNSVNCISTKTIQVPVNPNPTVTVVASKSLTCKGSSNTLTANGALTYSWSTGATTNTIVVAPTVSTLYNVTGVDSKGCQSAQQLFQANVSSCQGLAELNRSNQHISIYPNPSSGDITLQTNSDIVLRLVNGMGQEVKVFNLTESNNHRASVKDLANGVYFIVGENAEGKVNQKIVVAN
ncbi:MAG: T9SS type A sorting domain-containing protein [bacterium]|nr:T9SS type A sorting domain-containing protein [bacterium]